MAARRPFGSISTWGIVPTAKRVRSRGLRAYGPGAYGLARAWFACCSDPSVAERGCRKPENGSTEPNAGRRCELHANIAMWPRVPARDRRSLYGQPKPMICRLFCEAL